MKARDLARPHPELRPDAPAVDVARLIADPGIRAILVVDEHGAVRGVVSEADLLRFLLPPYVTEAEALAGVLEEEAAEALWRRLQGKTAHDLLPEEREELPEVAAEATLVEVASTMVRSGSPLVAVTEAGRILGGITIGRLLDHLLRP